MDVLAPATMKAAANCDTQCDLQKFGNHRTAQRKWHFFLQKVCSIQCLVYLKTSAFIVLGYAAFFFITILYIVLIKLSYLPNTIVTIVVGVVCICCQLKMVYHHVYNEYIYTCLMLCYCW